ASASVPVGRPVSCTPTLTDTRSALLTSGQTLSFSMTGTASGSVSPTSCTTNVSGQCTTSYTATVAGADTIKASFAGTTVYAASLDRKSVVEGMRLETTVRACTSTAVPGGAQDSGTATI